jgi:hypothetical protein
MYYCERNEEYYFVSFLMIVGTIGLMYVVVIVSLLNLN